MKIEKHLKIDGMSCGHCAMTVRQELESVEGIDVKNVKIGSAVIEVDEQQFSEAKLKSILAESGYQLIEMN